MCCAVALTVYFAAQYMVLNYVRKLSSVGHWWSHLKQLWFANVANNILWWAYIKACFRVARAYYGRGLEFKSTAKGKGAIAAAAWNLFQDLGIPGACLLLLLISLGEPWEHIPGHPNSAVKEGARKSHSHRRWLHLTACWVGYR